MSNFKELQKSLQDKFTALSNANSTLFYVDVDRDAVWETYLNAFEDEFKQGNTCNCCKSFIRQYSGVIAIHADNVKESIWNLNYVPDEYSSSIKALRDYIHARPVTDVFISETKNAGTPSNKDRVNNVTWNHFALVLDKKYVHSGASSIDTVRAEYRSTFDVFKRSLEEITQDSVDTILELIAQGSLYKGNEWKSRLEIFRKYQTAYLKTPIMLRDNFVWKNMIGLDPAISRIRSTVIGTVLTDLSEGRDLDSAVSSYEAKTAPTNYKRPKALVTPRMVEEAEKLITSLGYMDSLERRFAKDEDLNVNNIIFVDRSSEIKSVFADMKKDVKVNPKTFDKTEEISIADFIEKIVPQSKSIEILLENRHLPNFVSLITSDAEKSLFKWNNPFSWSYTGGITDSIKERVKAAGGNVNGALRVSLSWHNYDDLDLHVIEPNGNIIYFGNCRKPTLSATTGQLDVDMNAGHGQTREAVENIVWTDPAKMLGGIYQVKVHNYAKRETSGVGFTVQIECNGETFEIEYPANPSDQQFERIVKFEWDKITGIKMPSDVKSTLATKKKWNLDTNQFHRVKKAMFSPNYWENETAGGNKHFLFMLEDCVSDEEPRPFFNEFLKQELLENKRVFEVLGSKLRVPISTPQLSGVGFSDTQRNSFIARVEGNFKRNLKVNI